MTKGLWRPLIEKETELVKVAEGVDRTVLQVSSKPRGLPISSESSGQKIATRLREKDFFIEVIYGTTRHETFFPLTARGHLIDITDDDCLELHYIDSSATNVCSDRTTYIPWVLILAINVHRDIYK